METPLRVLLIEDCESDAQLVELELKRGRFSPHCTRVETADALLQMLKDETWDVIIADYILPHFDGLAAFRLFRETGLDIPFIIVSGSIGEDLAVLAMKAGIHDYVLKNNLGRLVPAIQRELRDAAERKARREAEERLRCAERLGIVGELTASLIHDLKNPLQSILSSSELLNTNELESEKRAKFCNLIDRQVQRILTMSEEVLDFVRGDINLTLESTQLSSLVQEIVDLYEGAFAKSGVDLACLIDRTDEPSQVILCDRQRIWRVLQNLINNAKDAMPSGGKIILRVGITDRMVVVGVSDTGDGIPESIRARLFEPFVTHGKKHGTGLGLAIVKNIVDAHGGTISFESTMGSGTTFWIKLPIDPPAVCGSQFAATARTPINQETIHA